jgi:hypothetical protein
VQPGAVVPGDGLNGGAAGGGSGRPGLLVEFKAVGSATAPERVRTPDQTEAAIWWDDLRLVERETTRQLAMTHRLDTLRTARLFAMVDMAAVDTMIACYKEKYHWSFWRR